MNAPSSGPGKATADLSIPTSAGSQIRDAVDQLRIGLNPLAIYLFGSQAPGDSTPDSDFDLAVIVEDSPSPRYERSQEARRLVHDKSVSKDIVVMTRSEWTKGLKVICSLPSTILREGRALYER